MKNINEMQQNLKVKVKIHKNKENKKRIISIIIISILLFSSISILLNAGFIPVNALQPIKKPVGNTQKIDVEKYIEQIPETKNNTDEQNQKEKQETNNTKQNLSEIPEIEYIKALKQIKYEIFTTDATINTVKSNYKQELEQEGYKLKYDKVKTKRGMKVHCLGFTKNLLAVGIMITKDAKDFFDQETVVIYSTGSVFEYKEFMKRFDVK